MTRWQIYCAIALRRLPEIAPQMDEIQSRVQDIFLKYELAKSKFSNHELRHLKEVELAENDDDTVVIKETAQDLEDRWMKEKSEFKFAPYNDRLSYTHYMFIKQKFGPTDDQDRWILPQSIYNPEEDSTLIDTARRAMKERLNIVNGYRIISKLPSSCYSFKYPKKLVETIGYDGAKVFFIKAILETNQSKLVKEALDEKEGKQLRWVTIDEAKEFVKKNYFRGLTKGLLEESRVDTKKVLEACLRTRRNNYLLNEQERKSAAVAQNRID